MFGPIESVRECGAKSAVVVFEDLSSACRAVSAFESRGPGTAVLCTWLHPFMRTQVRPPGPLADPP